MNMWSVNVLFNSYNIKAFKGENARKKGGRLVVSLGQRNVRRRNHLSDEEKPSPSVNQGAGSLTVTEPFGPKVLGVTRCGGKEIIKVNMLQNFIDP